MTNSTPIRRDFLRRSLGLATASVAGASAGAGVTAALMNRTLEIARPRRSLRLAHLTDTHLGPQLGAPEGFAACLGHAQTLTDRPQLIVTGGDNISSAFDADADRTRALWDLWNRQLRDHCSLPVEHCIGNRDIWGWDKTKSKTTGAEPRWGKGWALDALGLDRSYRSFDRAGWHFVVLDSIAPVQDNADPFGFQARLDDPQFEWLAADLAANRNTHTLIISHAPILSACVYLDGLYERTGDWVVPKAWMHIDARRIVDLLRNHPQVKACLSGHIHQVDRVDYQGVSYYCNGAVCGDWWKGPNLQCDCGYAVVDLYEDGSVENWYTTFDWSYRRT